MERMELWNILLVKQTDSVQTRHTRFIGLCIKTMTHIRVARRRAVIRHSSVYLQLKNRKPNSEETDMNSKRIGTLDNTANLLEQTIPADMDQVYHLVSNVWF